MTILRVVKYKNSYSDKLWDTEDEAIKEENIIEINSRLKNAMEGFVDLYSEDLDSIVNYLIENSDFIIETLTPISTIVLKED